MSRRVVRIGTIRICATSWYRIVFAWSFMLSFTAIEVVLTLLFTCRYEVVLVVALPLTARVIVVVGVVKEGTGEISATSRSRKVSAGAFTIRRGASATAEVAVIVALPLTSRGGATLATLSFVVVVVVGVGVVGVGVVRIGTIDVFATSQSRKEFAGAFTVRRGAEASIEDAVFLVTLSANLGVDFGSVLGDGHFTVFGVGVRVVDWVVDLVVFWVVDVHFPSDCFAFESARSDFSKTITT